MPFDGIVTRAALHELNEKIVPGKVSKIYQPTDTELLFSIRSKGKNHSLLFSIHPTYARFHLTEVTFKNPKEPPMYCMVLRKHLSSSYLADIRQYEMERMIIFTFQTRNEIGDESTKQLIVELMGKHSNIMLVDPEKEVIIDSMKHIPLSQNRHRIILPGQPYILPPDQGKWSALELSEEDFLKKLDFNAGKLDQQIVHTLDGFSPVIARELVHNAHLGSRSAYAKQFTKIKQKIKNHEYEPAIYKNKKEDFHVLPLSSFEGEVDHYSDISTMLDTFFSGKAERDRVKQKTKDLYRLIKNERDKNKRKLKKHFRTIKKAENAERYQKLGELLTAHMHLVRSGDEHVTVIDYYDPEQREMTIELDPNKTPSENAQSLFKTYTKQKKSKEMVTKEIKKTEDEISYLDQILHQLETITADDIEEIREELREEGYIKRKKQRKSYKNKPKKPVPEQYTATDGTVILVGKNNKQNEYVTMKAANRNDIWLHTKDIPGSHVVIRSSDPSEQTLLEGAQLAAYFSKSKHSSSVPVDYTHIRHVKKPNGAKPGFVTYDNQKTVFVTPEENIIQTLKKNG